MKPLFHRCSAIALVLGTSIISGCSSDVGEAFSESPAPVDPIAEPGNPTANTDDGAVDDTAAAPVAEEDAAPTAVLMPHPTPPELGLEEVTRDGMETRPDLSSLAPIQGLVTDQGPGQPSVGLAGPGTVAETATVRISELSATGALNLLAEVKVEADGQFTADVPLNLGTVIAQAVDLSGNVLGSVVVGASAQAAGDVVIAAPITTETSFEAEVLIDASSCSQATASANSAPLLYLDAAALIDAQLAAAVAAAASAGVDIDLLIDAVAQATVAATRARVQAVVDAGVAIDAAALLQARLDAIQTLNVGLTNVLNGSASIADVTTQLVADLDAALGVDAAAAADVRVRARVAASLAFSASLAGSLANVAALNGVMFAAIHAAALVEAQLAATAVADIVLLAGGNQAAVDAAVAAGAQLVADVASATNVQALTFARVDFVNALTGKTGGSGGLLVDLLTGTTGTVHVLLGSVLDTVAQLTADLDANLRAQLDAVASIDVCLDPDASLALDARLEALIQVLAQFAADVKALGPSLQAGTTSNVTADALVDMLAVAEILLRANP